VATSGTPDAPFIAGRPDDHVHDGPNREAYRSAADHERHFKEAPMSATSPAQLSYDAFVSDGPAGAGDERMPDGAPLAWSRPALPGLPETGS
jgi:hypothetical protein